MHLRQELADTEGLSFLCLLLIPQGQSIYRAGEMGYVTSPNFIHNCGALLGSQLHHQLGLWQSIPNTSQPWSGQAVLEKCADHLNPKAHFRPKVHLLQMQELLEEDMGLGHPGALAAQKSFYLSNFTATRLFSQSPSQTPLVKDPPLPLHKDISWCKVQNFQGSPPPISSNNPLGPYS